MRFEQQSHHLYHGEDGGSHTTITGATAVLTCLGSLIQEAGSFLHSGFLSFELVKNNVRVKPGGFRRGVGGVPRKLPLTVGEDAVMQGQHFEPVVVTFSSIGHVVVDGCSSDVLQQGRAN